MCAKGCEEYRDARGLPALGRLQYVSGEMVGVMVGQPGKNKLHFGVETRRLCPSTNTYAHDGLIANRCELAWTLTG